MSAAPRLFGAPALLTTGLDPVLLAISDPTRRAIVSRLARGPARISDVAAPFPMSLTGVCRHVRVRERAGLVRRTSRGRENTLERSAQPLRDVARWISTYERSTSGWTRAAPAGRGSAPRA